ncbi:MAG TPA: hypothetical protein VGI83_04005 [Gemmatimonadales bacterium]|jgi:hypothetical protein
MARLPFPRTRTTAALTALLAVAGCADTGFFEADAPGPVYDLVIYKGRGLPAPDEVRVVGTDTVRSTVVMGQLLVSFQNGLTYLDLGEVVDSAGVQTSQVRRLLGSLYRAPDGQGHFLWCNADCGDPLCELCGGPSTGPTLVATFNAAEFDVPAELTTNFYSPVPVNVEDSLSIGLTTLKLDSVGIARQGTSYHFNRH